MEKLKRYDLNCNIFNVYDYDGLSMQELLCQFFTKINECVDFSNSTLDLCSWLVNEGLKQEIALKLTNWLNDGTLEDIINASLFESLNNKIDNVESQLEHIVINVVNYGIGNNINSDDGVKLQSLIDTVEEYTEIYIPYGVTVYLKTGLIVNKTIRFNCKGEIKLLTHNMVGFTFNGYSPDSEDFTENQDFYIRKITGIPHKRTQTAFLMQHNMFSRFKIDHAYDLKHVVHFKGLEGYEKNSRIGENIWELVRWRLCDKIVYFEGTTNWENSSFCEGQQFINGFMSGSNHGIYIEDKIKAGGMLITCGIDNLEVANSYDFYNLCDTTKYTIGNLLLIRFIRDANCKFKENDMVMCPNFGTFLVGDLKVNGDIEAYKLDNNKINKTDRTLISKNGNIDITSSSIYPHINFKDNINDNYDARIGLSNGTDLAFYTGGSGTIYDNVYMKKGATRINPSGTVSIPAGSENYTIGLNAGVPSSNFSISITPSWLTTYKVMSKSKAGFIIGFGTPAPANATVDYVVFLNE